MDFNNVSGFKRRVLIVDDEMINREILGNILGNTYDVFFAENGQEALDVMHGAEKAFSLVLLDLLMPVMDGFEFITKMQQVSEFKHIPVIVMTSEREAEVKSIKLGASDFIAKPYHMPEVILARCERIIQLYEDNAIIGLTEKDAVTVLYHRDYFFEYIRQIETHRKSPVDVLAFNIDHFHLVNEMYGRQTGNEVLKLVADKLNEILDDNILIACRTEADTFYVYCDHIDDYSPFISRIKDEFENGTGPAKIRLRAGIYLNADPEIDIEIRFDRAKTACDKIRQDHMTSVAYYSKDLHLRSIYHERLIKDIDEAISNEDFKVYFQPKYDITDVHPKLRSAEALIRWEHPELGMISPGEFIPLFESNGLIQKIDNYVWNKAANKIKEWKDKFGYSVNVSVNVSRIDIFDPALQDKLKKIIDSNGLDESELMLEITESAYADNAGSLNEVTEKLRASGFKIEMDDFGSGYSSLNMITTIPIDVLKLDMSFIMNMEKDEKSLKLVEIILDIAKFLGVPVVAEGVETKAQLDMLKCMGCQVIQGYYFSKPVPAEEFEKFIIKEIS